LEGGVVCGWRVFFASFARGGVIYVVVKNWGGFFNFVLPIFFFLFLHCFSLFWWRGVGPLLLEKCLFFWSAWLFFYGSIP
ncbi:hypothetical protein ACQWFT_25660, partial [Salmonella enterica subsp. enterica serovar Infantis]